MLAPRLYSFFHYSLATEWPPASYSFTSPQQTEARWTKSALNYNRSWSTHSLLLYPYMQCLYPSMWIPADMDHTANWAYVRLEKVFPFDFEEVEELIMDRLLIRSKVTVAQLLISTGPS